MAPGGFFSMMAATIESLKLYTYAGWTIFEVNFIKYCKYGWIQLVCTRIRRLIVLILKPKIEISFIVTSNLIKCILRTFLEGSRQRMKIYGVVEGSSEYSLNFTYIYVVQETIAQCHNSCPKPVSLMYIEYINASSKKLQAKQILFGIP